MKDRTIIDKLGEFILGKGFYIVLLLGVAAVGLSGYYLLGRPGLEPAQPTVGDTSVVLPDSEANGPEPEGYLDARQSAAQPPAASTAKPAPIEVEPKQQPPTPVPEEKQSEQPQQEAQPEKPAALVFTWPVKGEVLRDFSVETLALDPTLGDWRTHGGLDIAAPVGMEVLAMAAGTVTEVYEDGLMGTTVVVDHGDGLSSAYANLAGQPTVEPGDWVDTGTLLGAVGQTAIAESGMSPHLHLEAWKDGAPADPRELLPER